MGHVFLGLLHDSLIFSIKRLNLLLFFIAPIALAFLLLWISGFNSYSTMGAIFIRYEDIKNVDLLTILLIIIITLVSAFVYSFASTGITLLVLHQRTKTASAIAAIKKDLLTFTMRLFQVRLFLQILSFFIFVFARFTPFSYLIYFLTIIFTFVPQSIVIEETKPFTAIKHSIKFISKNPGIVVLFYTIMIILLAVQEIFLLTKDLYVYFTIIYTNGIVLPYMEILASFIYLEKYQISKKSNHIK